MRDHNSSAEEWRPVPGFEQAYEVSNNGRVRSLARSVPVHRLGRAGARWVRGQERRLSKDQDGYLCVQLTWTPKNLFARVHRLVLSAFDRPPRPGEVARHRNSIPDDNRIENLQWGTNADNAEDRERAGRTARGVAIANAVLDPTIVRRIRASNESNVVLADRIGCSRQAVADARSGRRWAHVGDST